MTEQLAIYRALVSEPCRDLGWSPRYATREDLLLAGDLIGCVFSVSLRGEDQAEYERATARVRDVAWVLCDIGLGEPRLVFIDSEAALKNSVRSYKGHVPPKMRRPPFLQREIDLGVQRTVIATVCGVAEDTYQQAFGLTADLLRSFVAIVPAATDINAIADVAVGSAAIDSSIMLDYTRVAPRLCGLGALVLAFWTDPHEDRVSLRVFAPRLLEERLVSAMPGVS